MKTDVFKVGQVWLCGSHNTRLILRQIIEKLDDHIVCRYEIFDVSVMPRRLATACEPGQGISFRVSATEDGGSEGYWKTDAGTRLVACVYGH